MMSRIGDPEASSRGTNRDNKRLDISIKISSLPEGKGMAGSI